MIVSDTNVARLYGGWCERELRRQGVVAVRAVVPAGEKSKSIRMAAKLYAQAVEAGLDRGCAIVALGGGMVGDLAGFVAATLFRGMRLVQVPTTLLAMVDSSVGGKTAVNLPHGKNLVGAFHQPVEVTADLATLSTLPEREYLSGLAEVVKYGVIRDAALFNRLERESDRLLARDRGVLGAVVARCCEIKADVVAADEEEAGPRAILNFGHTLAHALETAAGYGRWLHGEAVSVGMLYAAALSVAEKGFPEDSRRRLAALLERLGLPVHPGARGKAASWRQLRSAMGADKKTSRGTPLFVLAERLGEAVYGCEMPEPRLRDAFEELLG